MIILDVKWAKQVNILLVKCDCGKEFWWPTNISLITCDCGNKEWWHGDAETWNLVYNINYKVAKNNRRKLRHKLRKTGIAHNEINVNPFITLTIFR